LKTHSKGFFLKFIEYYKKFHCLNCRFFRDWQRYCCKWIECYWF